MDGVNRDLLVCRTGLGEKTLLDAVGVCDDECRSVVVLSLVEGLDCCGGVGVNKVTVTLYVTLYGPRAAL